MTPHLPRIRPSVLDALVKAAGAIAGSIAGAAIVLAAASCVAGRL